MNDVIADYFQIIVDVQDRLEATTKPCPSMSCRVTCLSLRGSGKLKIFIQNGVSHFFSTLFFRFLSTGRLR
jgi:hypothetical protein